MSRQRRFARRRQEQDDFIDEEPYSPLTLRQPGDETDTDTITTGVSEETESEGSALQPYSHDVHVARRRESWARVLNTLDAHGRLIRSSVHHAAETGERVLDAGRTVFEEASFWIQVLCTTFFRVLWLLLRDIAFPILYLGFYFATLYIMVHALIAALIHGCGTTANALQTDAPVGFCELFNPAAGGRLLHAQLTNLLDANQDLFKDVTALHKPLQLHIADNSELGQLLTEMTVLSEFVKQHKEELKGHRNLIKHAKSSEQYALNLNTMMKNFKDEFVVYRYELVKKLRRILADAESSEPLSVWQSLFAEALYKVFPRAFVHDDSGRIATEYARVAKQLLEPHATAALIDKADQINKLFGGIQRIEMEAHKAVDTMRIAWTSSCKSTSTTAAAEVNSCYVDPGTAMRQFDAAMKRTESAVLVVKEKRRQLEAVRKQLAYMSGRLDRLLKDASGADAVFESRPRLFDLFEDETQEGLDKEDMHPVLARSILHRFIGMLRESGRAISKSRGGGHA